MPRSIAHLTRNASPTARTTTEPSASNCGNSLLDQQQPAEDQQEDADPRQARPARVVGAPLPVCSTRTPDSPGPRRRCRGRGGSPVPVDHPSMASSSDLVSALGIDRVEQRLAGQIAPHVLDDELVEEAQGDRPKHAA